MDVPETPNGLLIPTLATLRKYGLDAWTWYVHAARQGFVCGACGKLPRTCRLVIDHEHVRGWKNMPTLDRAQYVRGLLCWTCNGFRLARGATVSNLMGAALYLKDYQDRKAAA